MIKRILLIYILSLFAINLVAQCFNSLKDECEIGDSRDTKVTFTPQWHPQAQFAGYYAAQELGFYSNYGIDLTILHPYVSMNAMEMLKSGICNIVSTMLIEALTIKDSGFDIVNVMQIIPHSTMVMLSHTPLNNSIDSLRGKTIATWKAGFATSIKAVLQNEKIDVEWVEFLSGVNIFLSKSVDICTSMAYNEMQTIGETGYKVEDSHVFKISDLGYDIPEDGIYTTSEFLDKNPEIIENFRKATIEGWLWVAANKEKALEIVMTRAKELNIPTNIYHQRRMLNTLLEYGVAKSEESFTLTEQGFNVGYNLLFGAGLIKKEISYSNFVELPNN